MGTSLIVLAVVATFAAASVWYSTQMKKNYLCELEKEVEIQKFRLTGGLGSATVEGVWRGLRIWIEALPSGPAMPSAIHYKMEHRSTFTADIRPGAGLEEEMRGKAHPGPKEESDTARPWRARLTEEEQAIIDQRRGGATVVQEGPKERLKISSPKPDQVTQYLAQGTRNDDVVRLFKQGFVLAQIGFTEVVLVKSPYAALDMTPKVVEARLKMLRSMLVE